MGGRWKTVFYFTVFQQKKGFAGGMRDKETQQNAQMEQMRSIVHRSSEEKQQLRQAVCAVRQVLDAMRQL